MMDFSPFSESERNFLERIEKWRKKVVVVLTKADILDDSDQDLPKIIEFVTSRCVKEVICVCCSCEIANFSPQYEGFCGQPIDISHLFETCNESEKCSRLLVFALFNILNMEPSYHFFCLYFRTILTQYFQRPAERRKFQGQSGNEVNSVLWKNIYPR